ncbi:glycosyltransferase family 87 protein [Cupriavidus sp. IDO]|uniref:glycosyltransferase family 87 protein n=1 Tax=Cupriavidus sp. IDO TaxID=1539142 RepID=UPI00068BF7A8|nr:glycosyltransferase family 87 protein [Cupriavidus sp. IDO]KWR89528.1 hypothetical protein RM96_14285 [Cupriavidus sp. IDO]
MSVATENAAVCARGTGTVIGWFTAERVQLYAAALLIIECALTAAWWYCRWMQQDSTIPTIGWDFAVFWSASSLAQLHGPAAAYDWELLRAAEIPLLQNTFGPFAYPPTYLFVIYPIAAMSFGLALLLVSAIGVALYLYIVRAALGGLHSRWLIPALAFPGIWAALLAGQNSLFTASACGAALLLIRRNAVASGACIALLCVKPQFGVLFPLLLLCERRWAAIASAAGFSTLFAAIVGLSFGIEIFPAFARSMAMFREAVAEHGDYALRGAPTVFAVLRTAGVSVAHSYVIHAVVAAAAAGVCAWLWSTRPRLALSASALAVGTLIVQPYMIYYDLAWLAIPIALLSVDMALNGSTRLEKLIVVIAWLIPAHGLLVVLTQSMMQVAPLVLLALLGIIAHRHLRARRDGRPGNAAAAA